MTNEEAKEIMCKVTFYWELGEQTLTQNQINEAIDMAIKALEQQPCEDCISRKLLSDNICEGISCNECSFKEIDGECGCLLQKRFDELPSVTPTRPTGKWIDSYRQVVYRCSECNALFAISDMDDYSFCPNCGARMEGDDNAE